MGFSSYSRSNKDNRKLQEGIRSGHFKKLYVRNNKLNTVAGSSIEESRLQRAIQRKRRRVIKTLLYTIAITSLLIVFLFKILDKEIIRYNNQYNKTIADYVEQVKKEQGIELEQYNIKSYKYYVEIGKQHFQKGNIDGAVMNFYTAREYYDYGKDANIGLAVAYSFNCTNHKVDCYIARRYYNVALKSTSLTFEDLDLLEKHKSPDKFYAGSY